MTDIEQDGTLIEAQAPTKAACKAVPMVIPLALSVTAGFVDVCTFLAFSGLFVAQVTGSFVVAGAALGAGDDQGALIKVLAIPVFLFSGMVTALIVRAFAEDRCSALVVVLAMEIVLIEAMIAWALFQPASTALAVACGLAAMGTQSAAVRILMHEYGSTNVMTSNTTEFAIDVADLVRHLMGAQVDGIGDRLAKSGLPVVAFLCGTVIGAAGYHWAGLGSLWFVISGLGLIGAWIALRRA